MGRKAVLLSTYYVPGMMLEASFVDFWIALFNQHVMSPRCVLGSVPALIPPVSGVLLVSKRWAHPVFLMSLGVSAFQNELFYTGSIRHFTWWVGLAAHQPGFSVKTNLPRAP